MSEKFREFLFELPEGAKLEALGKVGDIFPGISPEFHDYIYIRFDQPVPEDYFAPRRETP